MTARNNPEAQYYVLDKWFDERGGLRFPCYLDQLWAQAQAEKLDRVVFYDRDRTDPVNPLAKMVKRAAYFGVVTSHEEPPDDRHLAFFWLNGRQGRTAQGHFAFFRAARPMARELAQLMVQWCFAGNPAFSALYGLTPARYGAALALIQSAGFEILGRLPGACHMAHLDAYEDGIISVVTPESAARAREEE